MKIYQIFWCNDETDCNALNFELYKTKESARSNLISALKNDKRCAREAAYNGFTTEEYIANLLENCVSIDEYELHE